MKESIHSQDNKDTHKSLGGHNKDIPKTWEVTTHQTGLSETLIDQTEKDIRKTLNNSLKDTF